MEAVLISIQPKWCEKIASGEKTIEVRKTKPKLETPFKVYIYCTVKKKREVFFTKEVFADEEGNWAMPHVGNGKVIGEFVCDKITPLFNVATTSWNLLSGNIHEYAKGLVRMARLTEKEMHEYAKGKNCFAYHISDLKIYDKPKELSEFKRVCNGNCQGCKYAIWETNGAKYEPYIVGCLPLKIQPQSWCYVEVDE